MFVFILIVFVVCLIVIPIWNKSVKIKRGIKKIDSVLESGLIEKEDADFLKENIRRGKWLNNIDDPLSKFIEFKERKERLSKKYGSEIAEKLIRCDYWIGMNAEQLIDCNGNPDKIEEQISSTKILKTYIYGNKSSGDYFVFNNDALTKFVKR